MNVAVVARRDPLHVVLVCAIVALALRGVGTWSFVVPVLGAAGVLAARSRVREHAARSTWLSVTAVGITACVVVRAALPGVPMHATALGLLASVAAGVGEEVVFRRGLYGALERWGALFAVVVSALVFGIVHAPMYGWTVVPVDIGAGLLFGWQRWATGGWTSPAITHVTANLLGAF